MSWDDIVSWFSGDTSYPTDYGYTPEPAYTPPSVTDTYDSYDLMGVTPSAFTPVTEPIATFPSSGETVDPYFGGVQSDMGSTYIPPIAFPSSGETVDPYTSQPQVLTGEQHLAQLAAADGIPGVHYTEARPVIDAGATASAQPSITDRITNALSGAEDFLTKNKNLVSLGVGGLQGLMAYQQQKKAAEQRKKQEAAMAEKLQGRERAVARYNAPINYGAYRTTREQLRPGLTDYRTSVADPRARMHFGTMPRISEAMEREAARAKDGGLIGYARGGLNSMRSKPRAVMGHTGGQDDKIPAMLSDGEFVMDADTVAALGDGNTQAGAAKLDKMRQNIRSHKRSAPKTKIPPKAKEPEQYLSGGKV